MTGSIVVVLLMLLCFVCLGCGLMQGCRQEDCRARDLHWTADHQARLPVATGGIACHMTVTCMSCDSYMAVIKVCFELPCQAALDCFIMLRSFCVVLHVSTQARPMCPAVQHAVFSPSSTALSRC